MRFTLSNLGRLEEATIDLGKDLIVLTGPNNTSKTYVAHAIYGFCQGAFNNVYPAVADLLAENDSEVDDRYEANLVALVSEHIDQLLERICEHFTKALPAIFAADQAFANHAKVTVEMNAHDRDHATNTLLGLDFRYALSSGTSVEKKRGSPLVSFMRAPSQLGQRKGMSLHAEAGAHIAVSLVNAVFGNVSHAYIFTSDRSAIQLFSRELSMKRSDLVESLLQASDRNTNATRGGRAELEDLLWRRASRYPQAIRAELEIADDLAKLSDARSEGFWWMAQELEEKMLGGGVSVTDGGEFRFRPSGSEADLRLHLASSSVRSLASLFFYLRHLAREGDFLIIDEPELNLHPDNQRRVARLLARLARSGIKVMISTHSDHIVRELNTLIMLHADKEGKLLEEFGYGREETLDPAQVGAYLFTPTRAEQVLVEPTGFDAKTIDAEITRENQSSQRIYFALFDK